MLLEKLRRTVTGVTTALLCTSCVQPEIGFDSSITCRYQDLVKVAKVSPPGTPLCELPFASEQIAAHGERLFYVSEDEKGNREPVSAAIFVPHGSPPAGGWPIIAWAHGTVGIAKDCAPSQRPNLFFDEYAAVVDAFSRAGYLVVAADYEGLGTRGLHKYLQLATEARNVVDGVAAARAQIPEAGKKWVAIGHSQGGHAALGVGELSAERLGVEDYLGTIAFAPAANLDQAPEILASYAPSDGYDILMFVASAIAEIYPDFRADELLSPELVEYLPKARTVCDDVLIADLMSFPPLEHPLAEQWSESAAVAEFLKVDEPAQVANAAPILLLQGSADQLVPAESTQIVRERACALGIRSAIVRSQGSLTTRSWSPVWPQRFSGRQIASQGWKHRATANHEHGRSEPERPVCSGRAARRSARRARHAAAVHLRAVWVKAKTGCRPQRPRPGCSVCALA